MVHTTLQSDELRECRDCGLFQRLERLRPGHTATCERCGAVLRKRRRNSLGTSLALASAGMLLLGVVWITPLLGFTLGGRQATTSLFQLPMAFETHDMPLLAIIVLGTTMVAPFLRLAATIGVLVGVMGRDVPHGLLVTLARLRDVLTPWSMIEVFLLGLFVAYTRLSALASVQIGIALYALAGLMLVTAWSDSWFDEDALWVAIERRAKRPRATPVAPIGGLIGCWACRLVSRGREGDACPRCDTPLRSRKPHAIGRTWALVIAAMVLYLPANLYPVMTVGRFGLGTPSTILGGVQELIEVRMWPLALLVFVASILVPVMKLLGLIVLLVLTQLRVRHRLLDRTRIYRIVDFIGRWSMIDMFMLSILTALVHMGILASVTPDDGAIAFASVVVLTMFAAFSFDPRLMWDAAELAASESASDDRSVPA